MGWIETAENVCEVKSRSKVWSGRTKQTDKKNTDPREKIRENGERRKGESDRKARQSEEQKGEITKN